MFENRFLVKQILSRCSIFFFSLTLVACSASEPAPPSSAKDIVKAACEQAGGVVEEFDSSDWANIRSALEEASSMDAKYKSDYAIVVSAQGDFNLNNQNVNQFEVEERIKAIQNLCSSKGEPNTPSAAPVARTMVYCFYDIFSPFMVNASDPSELAKYWTADEASEVVCDGTSAAKYMNPPGSPVIWAETPLQLEAYALIEESYGDSKDISSLYESCVETYFNTYKDGRNLEKEIDKNFVRAVLLLCPDHPMGNAWKEAIG